MPVTDSGPARGKRLIQGPKRLAPKEKKSMRSRLIPLLCALALILGACVGVFAASYLNVIELPQVLQARVDLLPDFSAQSGLLEEQPVEAGSYRVNLNSLPTIEAGNRVCNIQFENAKGNHYDARLSLYREDTGALLGHTHRVEIGRRVEELTLSEILPPGEYPVIGHIELFEGDELVSTLPMELTIRVVEKGTD